MVVVNSLPQQSNISYKKKILLIATTLIFINWIWFPSQQEESQLRGVQIHQPDQPIPTPIALNDEGGRNNEGSSIMCKYKSFSDLTDQERMPSTSGGRHMVVPPQGGKVSLVCCDTTAGPLSIVVHQNWASLGAERFLDMVKSRYFDSGVPFMRCVKDFLCQFGLNADKSKNKIYSSIQDDTNWLPEGPNFRMNEEGVKRFAQGYLAYAGAGKNSRGTQLIMSLKANGPLAGGSPWEVPWGELVGKESFETLGKINTEYGENGPPQGRLKNEGASKEIRSQWPNLDYINSCRLLDELS